MKWRKNEKIMLMVFVMSMHTYTNLVQINRSNLHWLPVLMDID